MKFQFTVNLFKRIGLILLTGFIVNGMLPSTTTAIGNPIPYDKKTLRKLGIYFVDDTVKDCSVSPSTTGASGNGLVWPFPTKADTQYERIDQGWDLRSSPGGAVFAVAPGILHVYKSDPGGFGNDYPTEQLDTTIGGLSNWIYYGHVHIVPSLINQHVNVGQLIAYTNTTNPENGSVAPPGWLEIGFAQPGTDAPIQSGPEGTKTPAGQQMHDILITAQASAAPSVSPACAACTVSQNISSSQIPPSDLDKIKQNQPIYEQASQQTNVPWQLLAAIHYRETSLRTNDSNIYQITDYRGSADFLAQTIAAGNFVQSKISTTLPNHRQPVTITGTDPEELKDILFSYNGRAAQYAQQAAQLGFDPATQPYEGSPYVMNNFDGKHMNMRIITRDNGPLDGTDTRLGAFTIYSLLLSSTGGPGGCTTNAAVPTGDSHELAKQILSNAAITFDYGPNGKVAQPFKDLAAGQLASSSPGCAPIDVSVHILQSALVLAQKHKVQISSLTTDHSCGDVHTSGRAIDYDYLDGKALGTSGFPNQIGSFDVPLSNSLMTDALSVLPAGTGFGDCDGHNIPTNGKEIIFFADNCNHVHVQVPPGQ
ncbi:MAG: hypothetical protein NVS1B7_1690 [Candidatus Saccharimonadales bacterium]